MVKDRDRDTVGGFRADRGLSCYLLRTFAPLRLLLLVLLRDAFCRCPLYVTARCIVKEQLKP
jgi:hypothetical protein